MHPSYGPIEILVFFVFLLTLIGLIDNILIFWSCK